MARRWMNGVRSPFLTERAQERGPIVMDYAAAAGAAVLVDREARPVLVSNVASLDVDFEWIARLAHSLAGRGVSSFRSGGCCVYTTTVRDGWTLCIVSAENIAPVVTNERIRKAAHVLSLAIADRYFATFDGGSNSGSGAPAQLWLPRSKMH